MFRSVIVLLGPNMDLGAGVQHCDEVEDGVLISEGTGPRDVGQKSEPRMEFPGDASTLTQTVDCTTKMRGTNTCPSVEVLNTDRYVQPACSEYAASKETGADPRAPPWAGRARYTTKRVRPRES